MAKIRGMTWHPLTRAVPCTLAAMPNLLGDRTLKEKTKIGLLLIGLLAFLAVAHIVIPVVQMFFE